MYGQNKIKHKRTILIMSRFNKLSLAAGVAVLSLAAIFLTAAPSASASGCPGSNYLPSFNQGGFGGGFGGGCAPYCMQCPNCPGCENCLGGGFGGGCQGGGCGQNSFGGFGGGCGGGFGY